MNVLNKLKATRNMSDHHQHKMSAVILLKGRPLAFGFNKLYKTHPMIKKYDAHKTIHAELAAVLKIKDISILSKCTMMVYRENRQGYSAMAKPCVTCQKLLKGFGIKEVVYSTSGGWDTIKL